MIRSSVDRKLFLETAFVHSPMCLAWLRPTQLGMSINHLHINQNTIINQFWTSIDISDFAVI